MFHSLGIKKTEHWSAQTGMRTIWVRRWGSLYRQNVSQGINIMGDLLFPAPEFLFLYSTKQLCMSLNLYEISSVRLAFTGCLGWNQTQGSDASALGSQALLGHRLTSLFETLSMFNMKVLPWNRTCVTGNKEFTEVTDGVKSRDVSFLDYRTCF